ncbi:MAG: hypothetical protein GY952_14070 [Rhodobacteraceae bacterium]|nr:hypothetical protein [Paracoccaceae bacterium]
MPIDIILYAPNKPTMAAFAKAHPPANPLLDAKGYPRKGVRYSWWGGSQGKFMTDPGNPTADPVVPPTFLPGVAMLLHIHSEFFDDNNITPEDDDYVKPADPDNIEQHERNRVVRYIKENGTEGTMGGVAYYEIDDVRLFRPKDVVAFIVANNVKGHRWVDGNSY